jgi:FAD:protein FMN transferase
MARRARAGAGQGRHMSKPATSRRRVLTILGAAMALPAGAMLLGEKLGALAPVQWHGETMGALASLTLWHRDPSFARRTIARMRGEIDRLDDIFSLYRPESEIVRLNRAGRLAAPSRDLVVVLEEARRIASASSGAFDPTVQPLWNAYATHFAVHAQTAEGPDSAVIDAARALTDFTAMDIAPRAIGFARAITLNAIAQGYITDRIADLLRHEGYAHAMVELGETRALGAAPDGQPFTVSLMNPGQPGIADRQVALADAALSVSGGYGLRFGASDSHHIFDPATGRSPNHLLDVAVIAPRATIADVLSTAIFVAGEQAAPAILRAYPAARAMITRADGTTAQL